MWRAFVALIVLSSCAHQRALASEFVTAFESACTTHSSFDELVANAHRQGFAVAEEASDENLPAVATAALWGRAGARSYSQAFRRDFAARTLHLVVLRYEAEDQRFTRRGLYDFAATSAGEVLAWRSEPTGVRSSRGSTTYEWAIEGDDRLVLRLVEQNSVAAAFRLSGLSLEYDQMEISP
jgi:hypothetical protein